MKYIYSILTIALFILASCGGTTNNSAGSDSAVHKHADGTTHSHDNNETHSHDSIPEGQEPFVVDEEEHTEDHKHNHEHPHEH